MSDVYSLIESVCKPGSNIEDMRTLLTTMAKQHELTNSLLGSNWLNPTSSTLAPQSQPPAQASAAVTGANGNIQLQLTNPAQAAKQTIYHQVSYSPVKNFSQNVTTLSVSSSTTFNIPAPGQQLFVRYRSSLDGQNWNTHALASNSAVDAGLQSSAATESGVVLNQSNYANVDSVANGSAAAVRIYGTSGPYHSYVALKGAQQQTRPSATIVNVPYDTTQVVSYDGSQFHLSPILPGALADSHEPVGVVNVVGTGVPTLPGVSLVLGAGGSIVGVNFTPGSGLTQDPTYAVHPGTSTGTGGALKGTGVSGGEETGIQVLNAGENYDGTSFVTAAGGVFTGANGGGTASGGNGGRLTAANL
jgi:hypothetical protein